MVLDGVVPNRNTDFKVSELRRNINNFVAGLYRCVKCRFQGYPSIRAQSELRRQILVSRSINVYSF